MSIKFSIITPTFNARDFVDRAVQSALKQTLSPHEIILVDDCSTDDTYDVISRIAENSKDIPIKILKTPVNMGPSGARNLAIQHCAGDWFSILDADDAFLPDRLENLQKAIETHKPDIIADNILYYFTDTQATSEPLFATNIGHREIDLETYFKHSRPNGDEADYGLLKPTISKSFWQEKSMSYPEFSRHGEDFLMIVESLLRGGKYLYIPASGYLYTARSSGLSRTIVDYDHVIEQTLKLAEDPRIASTPSLITLLKERAESAKPLAIAEHVKALFQRKDMMGLLKLSLTQKGYIAITAQKTANVIGKKMRKLTGK